MAKEIFMYDFIYWFSFKFFDWRKGFKSSSLSSAMGRLSIASHFLFIHSIVRYFTGWNLGTFSNNYTINKLILLPLAFCFFFIIDKFFYSARKEKILKKYADKEPILVSNILLYILTNMAVARFK